MAWEYGLLHSHDMPQILTAAQATVAYLRELIARRKREPADDLTTFCINAQIDGRPVADDEIVGMCFLLFLAGLDTVAAALGLSFRHLALHPEHQAQLRARPELIPDAVEELLRRYSMITSSRLVTEDMEFAGAPMRQGDRVIFSTPLANLDAGEFDQPLAVDFERTPNRHVAFLYGPHRCLGSHLARRELIIAMQEFLQRTPPFRLAPGETNTWFLEILGTDGGVRFSTKYPKTLWTFHRGTEQGWQCTDLGFHGPFPTVTGSIFEPGFPDCFLQMWAAFLAERAGKLDGRFGCVTPQEAVESHQLFAAALQSVTEKRAISLD